MRFRLRRTAEERHPWRRRHGLASCRRRAIAVGLLLGAFALAGVILAAPRIMIALAGRLVAERLEGDFSCERIRPDGWRGVVIESPALRRDGRTLFSADRVALGFAIAGREWSLSSIRVDRPAVALEREDLPRLFRPQPPDPVPWSFTLAVSDGSGVLLGEAFSALAVDGVVSGIGDDLTVDLARIVAVILGEPVTGRGTWRDESGSARLDADLRWGATLARLDWTDSLAFTLDRPDPADLRRIAARLIARFPSVSVDSRIIDGLARLDHLSLVTDLAANHVGLVTGLRHDAFDGELLHAGFSVRGNVVAFDSIVAIAMVRGETTRLSAPAALVSEGAFLLPRLLATGDRLRFEGSDLRIDGQGLSAEVDLFEADLAAMRVKARGRVAGPLASPGFDGTLQLRGLRFPHGGADLEMKVGLTDLLDRLAGRIDLTGGRITLGEYLFRPSASGIQLDPGHLRFTAPLRLVAPGIEAAVQGTLGLSGPLSAMLGRIEWRAAAEDFLLPMLDSAIVARLEASGRGTERWRVTATSAAMPEMTLAALEAERTETGISVSVEDLRRDAIVITLGRLVLDAGGREIERLEAQGILAETLPFDLTVADRRLALSIDGRTWRGPMRLLWEGDRLRITAEEIEGDGGRLSLAGTLFGPDGVRLASRFEARLAEILPPRALDELGLAALDGRLRGEARWGETATLTATLEEGSLETLDGVRFSRLTSEIAWSGDPGGASILKIARLHGATEGGEFEAGGELRLEAGRPAWIDAHWTSRDFALAALAGLDTRLRELSGRADAQIEISGAWHEPKLKGHLDLRGIAVPIAALGVLRDASGRVEFANGGGSIRLAGRMGNGEISASGPIGAATRIAIRLAAVPLRPLDGVDGRFSGDLLLTRPYRDRYRLEGDLTVEDARVLTERFAAPADDRVAVETSHLDLALEIEIASIRLSGPDLLLSGKGRLALRGTEIAPKATGLIECQAGRLVTRNATFRVREARIVLPEHGEITITAQAAARVDRIRIFADVNGPISEPRITLTSSPERSEAEIVTLLAVGREISEEGVVTNVTSQSMASLALPIASAAGTGIGSGFGLENFRLEKSETDTGGALFDRVAIGGYVTDRVYLGYSQATGVDPERRIEMEFEVSPQLFIKFEAGDRGTAGAGLEWRRDY
jgi:hypothetical protein